MPFLVVPQHGRRPRASAWRWGGGAVVMALSACGLSSVQLLASPAAWAVATAATASPSRPALRAAIAATPPGSSGAPGQSGAAVNQPNAIDRPGLLPPPCPLIVSPDLPSLQPIRIQPSQVAAKNRMGCLSAADAIYGPDGCPLKLCPPTSGAFPAAQPR